MKPEEGGSWFVLVVDSPLSKRLILDAESATSACNSFETNLIVAMKNDGFVPIKDEEGNWYAFRLDKNVLPYTVPNSICHLASFVASGTVITFDNGYFPSIEWHFKSDSIKVVDVYDDSFTKFAQNGQIIEDENS